MAPEKKPTTKAPAKSADKAAPKSASKAPDASKSVTKRAARAAKAAAVAHGHGARAKSKTPIAPIAADVKGTRVGVVESDKRPQTRRVVVAYATKHPKYGKYIRQRTVLHVHDGKNESRSGDVVEVAPCRPISKTKSWRLVRVVERRSELAAALESVKAIGEQQ